MTVSSGALPLILSCSPRQGGNCDTATALFAESLGLPADMFNMRPLRDSAVSPCVSCGTCDARPGVSCPLESADESAPLLEALVTAPALCVVAPVYFYHLPARMKVLIDRSQAYWAAKTANMPLPGLVPRPLRRRAWVILLAGRKQGKQLFTGSLLTLKYWLRIFNIEMEPPLLLRGMERVGDISASSESRARIAEYAAGARESFARAQVGNNAPRHP